MLIGAWRNSPVLHRILLVAGPALLVGWFVVRGESAKQLVAILGFAVLIATALAAMKQVLIVGAHRALILVALVLALGSCGTERWLFFSDVSRTLSEIQAMDCGSARRIAAGLPVPGRDWRVFREGVHTAPAPTAWRWVDLYLHAPNESAREQYAVTAGAWTNDMVDAVVDCPEPGTPRTAMR